jgi:hypothetical protein
MTNKDLDKMTLVALRNIMTLDDEPAYEEAKRFVREVADIILSEARGRIHGLISDGRFDPGNVIRVFKTMKNELAIERADKTQERKA